MKRQGKRKEIYSVGGIDYAGCVCKVYEYMSDFDNAMKFYLFGEHKKRVTRGGRSEDDTTNKQTLCM
jgi:hypothetical protein